MKLLHVALILATGVYTLGAHDTENGQSHPKEHSFRDITESIANVKSEPIGKLRGQLRSMYAGYHQRVSGVNDTYATALGGYLNFTSNDIQGLSVGTELAFAKDLHFATGERSFGKNNDELSSSDGKYTELSQAYLSYSYDALNIQAGRILIDTPLADSDDIRMIHDTFSGAVATYDYEGITFMAGHLSKWQGIDTGLDTPWSKTGTNGTNFGGISYEDIFEFSIWYYNITDMTNAFYADIGYLYHFNKAIDFHLGAQYLNESQLNNSGVDTGIYGLLGEAIVGNANFGLAYNHSRKNGVGESSFSGFGGGTLYTNMDTMILNELTNNRSASSLVAGASYEINRLNLTYAYGDFQGDADSVGVQEHIVEQDIIVEYNYKAFTSAFTYAISQDRQNLVKTAYDWERTQLLFAYNF